MDVALQEEENKTPLRNRAQHACLLIGAGGTGKTTIILELMLDVFCRFFPARPGEEERYMIATFSHAQSDAISNDVYRARTCHTACSYRVASLRNKHLALKTKEQEMKQRWQPKILVIQDEISLVPAAVENMMLYRSMRARRDEGLDPASYFHPGELMGHIPILLIAGDFLQIKPANEISLADNLEELIRKMPHRVQTEHHAAQAALMTIDTVIHLKKSKRFLDAHLPEITTAMRTCTPAAPLSEDHLAQLRTRKIENCKKELTTDLFKHGHVIGMYWENIARSMVERANLIRFLLLQSETIKNYYFFIFFIFISIFTFIIIFISVFFHFIFIFFHFCSSPFAIKLHFFSFATSFVFHFPLFLMVFHCFSLFFMAFLDFRCHGQGK